MTCSKLIVATAGFILAGAGALDILGDQSVPVDTVRIATVSNNASSPPVLGNARIDVPRTVSCPIEPAAVDDLK
ncbi:hypothetical protein [Nocardia sp. NBC_01009]|uniref:hypothetical protein n=1 Tax=Nocardia sp. NBC_01009 TaxID=2975996 RepID=UPI0038686E53|nr:hypothetical protein OHA42_22555 [Nocardia sp. NBC_01009]